MILFRLEEVDGEDARIEGGRTATMTRPETRPRAQLIEEAPPRTAPPPTARRRRFRVPVAAIAVLVVLLIVGGGLWTATRAVYFVGVDDGGAVTIYQGLPYDLPFGVALYDRFYTSGVTLAQVPEPRRVTFTEHKLRSKDDAENLVSELERGRIQ